ncbi:hypothetical protein V9T40_008776 [Parthenolecanium corni]|uniref:Glutamate--cysteine ligase n=1 Tax=Parthenolecanium corni TaxID=536013 RepID=A0AAN9TLI4_9HEMI
MNPSTSFKNKMSRRMKKYSCMLHEETGIAEACKSKYLMVCNAGLVSGIKQDSIVDVFSKYSIQRVLMVPGKSYSFVELASDEVANQAINDINGKLVLPEVKGPLYLLLVEKRTFSVAEMHSWIIQCLPDLPEKPSDDERVFYTFKSSLLETVLQCTYALGCPDFTWPLYKPNPKSGASHSLFFPEEAIFLDHPRFATLTRNIRERRGEKVAINLPIFKDKNTPSPFIEDFSILGDDGESARAALPDHVYLDAMGFGMGCCRGDDTY